MVFSAKTNGAEEWKAIISAISTLVEEATFEATVEGISFRGISILTKFSCLQNPPKTMEEDTGSPIGLSAVMKLTGILPIFLGTMFLLTPKTAIAVGPYLTEYGVFVSMYVGVFAIFIGLTQWFVAIYVKENLHVFGRLFALGLGSTVLLEIYGWTSDLMEFELKFLFATMIPVSATFVLLMYSITPEKPKTVDSDEN